MKQAWEYRKIDLTASNHGIGDIELLNAAGEQGWEVVHISSENIAYLKRPIEEPARRNCWPPFRADE
jgi:hypothetical protein